MTSRPLSAPARGFAVKAISLTEPWATLAVHGHKRFETRSWQRAYRGDLVIHASKTWNPALAALCKTEPVFSALRQCGAVDLAGNWKGPRGCLLGKVRLVAIYRVDGSLLVGPDDTPGLQPLPEEPERSFGDYGHGRYAWLLADPQPFPRPILWRGSLGLFDVPDDRVARAAEAG